MICNIYRDMDACTDAKYTTSNEGTLVVGCGTFFVTPPVFAAVIG